MITSAKNYTKNTKQNKTKNGQSELQDKWQKQSYTDKNHTKKHTHTHSQKEKKEKYVYIKKIKKGREQPNQ